MLPPRDKLFPYCLVVDDDGRDAQESYRYMRSAVRAAATVLYSKYRVIDGLLHIWHPNGQHTTTDGEGEDYDALAAHILAGEKLTIGPIAYAGYNDTWAITLDSILPDTHPAYPHKDMEVLRSFGS